MVIEKKAKKKLTPEALDCRAFQMLERRVAGESLKHIADDLGLEMRSASIIISAALRVLKNDTKKVAEEVREIELMRLDQIVAAHMPLINGTRNADIIIKTMERRARYLGLDAQPETGNEDSAEVLRNFLAAARANTGAAE